MPTGDYNLLDLAKLDAGVGYSVIDETIEQAREMERIPAETILGSSMELSVLKTLPTAAFRNANEGTARSKAAFENKIFQTHIIDHQVAVDKQIVDGAKDPARLLNTHARAAMKSILKHASSQFWYGDGNDAKGFPGMIAQHDTSSTHNSDVTGTTNKSSVWMLQVGAENLHFIFGNDQTIMMSEDWKEETVYDDNNNPYQAYTNWITGRIGCRLANKNAAVRIKNIGTGAGKKLTDSFLYAGLQLCEELGMQPNLIVGNPRSFYQLRDSRTATNSDGRPAPLPRDWEGIPLLSTINITTSES